VLSIALIGPDEERRKAAATALAGCQGGEIREFSSYPPSLDDVPKLLEQHYDVIIIDLDSHPNTPWNWWRASAPTARRR
jgi:pilus assembly protein CpaE